MASSPSLSIHVLCSLGAILLAINTIPTANARRVVINSQHPHINKGMMTPGMTGGCPFMKATGLNHHPSKEAVPPKPTRRATSTDPLSQANSMFHSVYNQSHVAMTNMNNPRLYVLGSSFIIHANNTEKVVPYDSREFQDKKMVCHLPLAAFVTLVPFANGQPFSPFLIAALNELLVSVSATSTAVANTTRFPNTTARQQAIQQATESFLNTTLTAGSITRATLDTFVQSIVANVLLNVNDAAVAMVKTLDATVQTVWPQRTIPKDLHVVVQTSHQATRQSLVLQYFACVLNTTMYSGDRLVYLQSGATEPGEGKFNDLLGTILLDSEISKTWFPGVPFRMQRDLLSDDARAYITKNFPCIAQQNPVFTGYEES